jgi:hypothetical protein
MPIKTELWDGVTAPAIPSGWNVDANFSTSSGFTPVSSPNVLLLASGATTATNFYATWGTADGNSGYVTVSGYVQFGVGNKERLGVTARGSASTLNNSSTSFYACYLSLNPNFPALNSLVQIVKIVNGTETSLVAGTTVLGSRFTTGAWYQVIFSLNGPTLSCQVVRVSDGFYLQTSNAFGAGAATYLTVTDATIGGSGYAGYFANQGTATSNLIADDWQLDSIVVPYRFTVRRRIAGAAPRRRRLIH